MPLIQWISQNILNANATGGGMGGGSALVQQTSYIVASGGAKGAGNAFYEKVLTLVSAGGGGVGGGSATVEKSTAFQKRINYLPGDKVYFNNRPWVIISFQYSDVEPLFKLVSNKNEELVYQSELSDQPRQLPFGAPGNSLGLPAFAGTKVINIPSPEFNLSRELNIVQEKINLFETRPMNNYPTYPGRRKVNL